MSGGISFLTDASGRRTLGSCFTREEPLFVKAPPEHCKSRREPAFYGRRRFPRLKLNVEWIAESQTDGAWGCGLEISLRGLRLPLHTSQKLRGKVTLRLAVSRGSANVLRPAVSCFRGQAWGIPVRGRFRGGLRSSGGRPESGFVRPRLDLRPSAEV